MELLVFTTILLYMSSSAGYIVFLFHQKDYLQRTGYILLGTGFFCHSISIGYEFAGTGHFPINNLQGTLSLAGWALAGVFLAFQFRYELKVQGVFAAPSAALAMLVSSLLPGNGPPGLFKDFWFFSHVIIIFLGEASFALACGTGALYLIQEHGIKVKKRGFFYSRLPSLDLLDTTGYACLATGFTLLTIGLVTGFVYAKLVWGRYWSGDPKEVWSFISWIIYAILLHERIAVGWRGRKSAVMSIIGFGFLVFTFIGVNFLMQGHHGDFTRW